MIKLNAIKREDLEIIRQWRNDWALKYFRQYRDLTIADQEKWYNNNFDGSIMFGIYEGHEVKGNAILNNALDKAAHEILEFYNRFKLIGICGLCYLDHFNKRCDLSIYIGNTYIDIRALDALKLLYEYAFNQLGIQTVFNDLFNYDEKKKDILLRSGMKEEGRLKNRYYRNGQYNDAILFSITKEDWDKLNDK